MMEEYIHTTTFVTSIIILVAVWEKKKIPMPPSPETMAGHPPSMITLDVRHRDVHRETHLILFVDQTNRSCLVVRKSTVFYPVWEKIAIMRCFIHCCGSG